MVVAQEAERALRSTAPLPSRVVARGLNDRAVAGEVLVPADALAAKLGDGAWRTLQALWTVRDGHGRTHITRAGLAELDGFEAMTESAVMKALARLSDAALVRKVGWQRSRVPSGGAFVERDVYVRLIRGGRALGTAPGLLIVPAETSAWLTSAPGWGGYRWGRKGGQEGSTPLESSGVGPGSRRVDPPTSGQGQEGSPMNKKRRENNSSHGVSGLRPETGAAGAALPAGSTPRAGRARDGGARAPQPGAGASEASRTPSAPSTPAGSFLGAPGGREPGAHLGSTLGAAGARPMAPIDGIPPYPGASLIAPAVLPNPPLLSEDMGDLERADMLATAFRAAAESRFGGRCWAFRGGPLLRSKFYDMLVVAASTLLDLEFSPAAWCAFSCDVWKASAERRGTKKKVNHPPVVWVFNANRIVERRGWFRAEEANYMGGRIVYGPKHRALLARYAGMQAELSARRESAAAIVERYFPNWDRTVADVRAEVAELQQSLKARAERGEFLW